MRTKQIFFLGLALLGAGTAAAQTPIQREVDVTRAYEPSVQHSLKLNIMPDMADTSQMRPDFQYEITPRPLNYGFAVNPLTPARLAAVSETAPLPFYAKLGAGYPLQSVADIRYTKALNDRTDFGLYGSHYGRYGKLKNDMQIKESAFGTDNRAGAFLDFRPEDDFRINAELGYDFRNVTRYGYYSQTTQVPNWIDTSDDYLKQFYHDLKFDFSAGNSFTDLEKFNFNVGGGIDYFADRFKYDQFGWNISALLGFRAGQDGFLTVGTEAFGANGMNNFSDFSSITGYPQIAYYFYNGDFRFKLGAKIGYTETKLGDAKKDKNLFLPELTIEKALAGGKFTPFIDIRGEVIDNSYGALAKRNPYLYSGQYALNTTSYNGRAGVKGTLGRTFKYTLYGGYTIQKDATFWANAYSGYDTPANGATYTFPGYGGNVFTVLTDDLNYFEAGFEFQTNIRNALSWNGGLNYQGYSPDTFDEAWGMPELTVNTGLTYNHRNRLYLNAGVEYTGKRQMYSFYAGGTSNEVAGQTNLKFGVDYFINKQFGVFLQLDNLLNQDIYHFNRYREPGINGMAGIKISF